MNTIALGYLYNQDKKASLAENIKIQKSVVPKTAEVPAVPSAPVAPAAPKEK